MDSLEFRPAARRVLLAWGWVGTALVLLGIGGLLIGGGAGLLVLPGLAGLIIAPMALNLGSGHTALTPHGIRTHRLVSRHSCPWSKVAGISTRKASGGRNRWVVVTRRDGKKFQLAAPFDSGNGRDKEFDAKVGQILRYWARVRGDAPTTWPETSQTES